MPPRGKAYLMVVGEVVAHQAGGRVDDPLPEYVVTESVRYRMPGGTLRTFFNEKKQGHEWSTYVSLSFLSHGTRDGLRAETPMITES